MADSVNIAQLLDSSETRKTCRLIALDTSKHGNSRSNIHKNTALNL